MTNRQTAIMAFMLGWLFGLLLVVPFSTARWVWHQEAIRHNAAEYDIETGQFKWKGEK